jgi:hypothetical protein
MLPTEFNDLVDESIDKIQSRIEQVSLIPYCLTIALLIFKILDVGKYAWTSCLVPVAVFTLAIFFENLMLISSRFFKK